jgi:hypothetical protein
LEDRHAIEDAPQPELAQRVYRLEERLDRLLVHLASNLGMSVDEREQL